MLAKKKQAPKKPTDEELKEKLWELACMIDWSNEGEEAFCDLDDWEDWEKAMTHRAPKIRTIPGFDIPSFDLKKIRSEVEDSCLSNAAKNNILNALKASKAK